MRDYSTISPQFWLGKTGRVLRGKPEAQLVALYLMTSPHATAIGIFHCPVLYISHETGSPFEGASKGLIDLVDVGFCLFDEDTEEVFVINMARHQIGETLAAKDKRVSWVNRTLQNVRSDRLRKAFIAIYSVAYNLPKTADSGPKNTSPFEAPSKPLRSQEQEQEQEQEQKGGERARPTSPNPSADASPPPFFPEYREFIKTERPDLDADVVFSNFIDHYPPAKCSAANWRKWVRREHPGSAHAAGPPKADPDSRSAIETIGLALGMGQWDQLIEQWDAYKTRVKKGLPA